MVEGCANHGASSHALQGDSQTPSDFGTPARDRRVIRLRCLWRWAETQKWHLHARVLLNLAELQAFMRTSTIVEIVKGLIGKPPSDSLIPEL